MKKRILALVLAVVLALGAGVAGYAGDYYPAEETALAALAGDDAVTVTQGRRYTVFAPAEAEVGLIFYPGGKVEHLAYAPLLRELARQGVLCVLVEMPLKLAVLDADAAKDIPGDFPEIQTWYIGGHSLGGSMAASWAGKNAGALAGVVLLAAYSTRDLAESGLRVLSIYGSRDTVMNMENYDTCREKLPADTREIILPGGNHAQFGSYGPQAGDGAAEIPAQEQQQRTAEAVAAWIKEN